MRKREREKRKIYIKEGSREPLLRGKLSTVDLLVPTTSDRLLLMIQNLLTFYKTSYLLRRSTVLNLPLQLVFPGGRNADSIVAMMKHIFPYIN